MKIKSGPLSQAELMEVWRGAVDPSFSEPLEAAGDGEGIESHTQGLAQLARVSKAIDRTTQGMFICPWSGQTGEPASGARKSRVVLTFVRNRLLDRAMVLRKGQIFVEERAIDWGTPEGEEVTSGRRYVLVSDLVFPAGETGPFEVEAEAERDGEGYDNPLPGSLRAILQPGAVFENSLATLTASPGVLSGTAVSATAVARIVTPNVPDTFVPEHVGQYVYFVSGSNAGTIARIEDFAGPDLSLSPPVGSAVGLAWEVCVQGTSAGIFVPGERVSIGATTFVGEVLASLPGSVEKMTLRAVAFTAAPAIGDVLVSASGASFTIDFVSHVPAFVPEAPVGIVGGVGWRLLDWVQDWGLSVTNVLSPSGGRHPWLDEIGAERGVHRAPGEDDDTYRQRVKSIADVVSPNAIRRTLSRTLGAMPWCFREVGTEDLPGFFYDGDLSPPSASPHGVLNDAYDYENAFHFGAEGLDGYVSFDAVTDGDFVWAIGASELLRVDAKTGQVTAFPYPAPVSSISPYAGAWGKPRIGVDGTHVFLTTADRYFLLFKKTAQAFTGVGELLAGSEGYGIASNDSDQILVASYNATPSDGGLWQFSKISLEAAFPATSSYFASLSTPLMPASTTNVREVVFGGGSFFVAGFDASLRPRLFRILTGFVVIVSAFWAEASLSNAGTPVRLIHAAGSPYLATEAVLGAPQVRRFVSTMGLTLAASLAIPIFTDPAGLTYDGYRVWVSATVTFHALSLVPETLAIDRTLEDPYASAHSWALFVRGKVWLGRKIFSTPTFGVSRIAVSGLAVPEWRSSLFEFGEPVHAEHANGDVIAAGWFGRYEFQSGAWFIPRFGRVPDVPAPGTVLRGLTSGAVIALSGALQPAAVSARKFRVYLDYSQFRGFFLVCLNPLGLGEFGFAYDNSPAGAFDVPAPYRNFFDGYPYLNASVYSRVYAAIDSVRAGGVLFDLCLDPECGA